ncbi:ATP synthase F0 subunit A [Candidatus Gottesmanbacteria bacterium RIFCSPHIGHO2_01_FULL_39_10]|uniref:ATP synthase subunit a n=1 Tax=Candidatus Gottesmanbacteria bacterium RIFCSPHIGHO2_01_FULL_39_10 TaxID=1798375 RepID=A0A1F5ZL17_9BACT|nr:MAG: ATP synthase F0 subunit A [Candidatus Gottesmanbacteria bacterium RIFCSPHIGHO2_01_FULL_39_10]
MESTLHISISAEKVFTIFDKIPITNSILTTWLVMAFLFIFSLFATRKLSLVPGHIQSLAEIIVEGLYGLYESVIGDKIKTYFPLLATLFIFIMFLNWAGLLPGVGTIGLEKIDGEHKEFIPLFRSGSADLNMTIALALIAFLVIQFTGIKNLGLSYFKKFLNFTNPINFFVGILELLSEFSKIISFAFRLFGNIFAGEVLLTVIAFLIPLIAPLPFLGLELFVGFIQALVFSMLTAAFISLAVAEAH